MIKKLIYIVGLWLALSPIMAQQPQKWVKIVKNYPSDQSAEGAFDFDSVGNIYFPTFFRTKHSVLYILDQYGNTVNKKHFTSSNDNSSVVKCIVETNNITLLGDNDYHVLNNRAAPPQLIKMDFCGNLIYQKNYIDTLIGIASFFERIQNGYIIGFYYTTSTEIYSVITEFDMNGNILKQRSYPTTFHSYLQTEQGPVITGQRWMYNPFDSSITSTFATIARLDTNDLGLTWYHPHNNTEYRTSLGNSVVVNKDGSLLFNTFIENTKGVASISSFMQKYDATGNLQWIRPTSDSFKAEFPYKSVKINDSVIFEVGVKADSPYRVNNDYLMVRLIDTSGKVLKTRGYPEYAVEPAVLKMTPDNKLMVAGTIFNTGYYRPFLIKFRQDLEIDTFTNPGPTPTGLCTNFNNDTINMDSAEVVWLKIEKPTGIVLPPNFNTNQTELEYFRVFPNPSNNILYIQSRTYDLVDYTIYDSKGALVYTGKFAGTLQGVDIENYIPGIYFIKIENGRYSKSFKVIKE